MSSNLRRFALRLSSTCCLLAIVAFAARAQPLTFTTFAGPVGGPGIADGTGSVARFWNPRGVATDSAGNVYVADGANAAIRKITPAGAVTTLAGSAGSVGTTGPSADGTGYAARFSCPSGVATDSGGNVYVADPCSGLIRKITPAGVTTTLAAGFAGPFGVATDSDSNVYVADTLGNTIRKVTPAGVVTTLAGSGGTGSADGTGSAASFNNPSGVATDSGGNVYVADASNHTIRKITPQGVVTTLAGTAGLGGSADGTGSAAHFLGPVGVATDSGGNVYVADYGNETIRKITSAGVVTTLAGLGGSNGSPGSFGSADGTGSDARFFDPSSVAADGSGNVYVADTDNDTIRKVTPAGVVTTLAGLAGVRQLWGSYYMSADGTGSAARFLRPFGVATDSGGNVYVADTLNDTIRKITPAGVVTTLAGLAGIAGSADGFGSFARFKFPTGVATDSGGNVYVADAGNYTIRKITPAGVVTTLAGSAGLQGSADGTGSAARFAGPTGVATDSGGNVYVADAGIRKITPTGVVTTLFGGAATFGFSLTGVAIDSVGNIYVADSNSTIWKFTPPGVMTTLVAGSGCCVNGDGVATDSGGNVYVADTLNSTILKINPAGVVTTVGGLAGAVNFSSVDGTGSAARFQNPTGVAIDSAGNVYVADMENHSIRIGRPGLPDAATIDFSTGTVGTTRQLDTAPQTATSWQWTLIRRPAASTAQLSSASIPNPLFTPDVPDLFIFQLTASNGVTTSITTVSLTATPLVTCPVVTVNPATLPNGGVGIPYNQTISATGATGSLTFSVTTGALPAGLSITAATGVITGTPTSAGTFNSTITATDANGCAGSQAYSIVIAPLACPVITVNPGTLPDGVVGTAYNQTISATGGTAPYAFSVTAGALPGGLSLNAATGGITGTPNLAGTFNFTITAKDTNLCPGNRAYSIVIGPPVCPAIGLSPATLPDGAIGGAYNKTISAFGGTVPYAFSVTAGALPNGLSLNATTGAITGAPNLAGTFTFTITATDTNGCSGSQAFTLTITIAFGQISLGTAQSFAVLGGSGVTNTGVSLIRGDVGVSPGTSVTGFPTGVVTGGTIHAGDAVAAQAQTDLTTAYNAVAGMPCNFSLGGSDIGGRTLRPGVYCFPGPILTGTLILDFQGDPNAVFLFQTISVFMTAANSSVVTINAGGSTCPPNVFWQVGFPFLGANSVFVGNILSNSDITLGTGARLYGRALARNGAVTLDTNTVGMCPTVIINGDANGDGTTTVGDIFYLINSLFAGGPVPIGLTDVNGDGQITVGDIFYLINYLFAGGPPPV